MRQRKKEMIAMILAGGQGSRLKQLTKKVAKPAVPFGGKFRIIDFTLSNCSNSGIDTVGILTQYEPYELNNHIGIGTPWDLDRQHGGVKILPPYTTSEGGRWYKGTANAIFENINFIDYYSPKYVLLLSGDHIYNMDYSEMLSRHKESEAELTVAVKEVPWDEASRFGILAADENDIIYEFAEKPAEPKSNLASMGIYIFNWDVLREKLISDENNPESANDFGKNIIPQMVSNNERIAAYRFNAYWKDVGTVNSLWEANMDLLQDDCELDLHNNDWRNYSVNTISPAQYISSTGVVENSLINDGCIVEGHVINSVISPRVEIGKNSRIKNSVIMPNAIIEENVSLSKAIVMSGAIVKEGTVVDCVGDEIQIITPE